MRSYNGYIARRNPHSDIPSNEVLASGPASEVVDFVWCTHNTIGSLITVAHVTGDTETTIDQFIVTEDRMPKRTPLGIYLWAYADRTTADWKDALRALPESRTS
jgi:hypothetical protein